MENIVLKVRFSFFEEIGYKSLNNEFLEYYLIKNSNDYGIKVVKECDNQGYVYEEVFYFKNLGDLNKATKILEVLARNKVTPIGADEIINDLINNE